MVKYLILMFAFIPSVAHAAEECMTRDEAQAWASDLGTGEIVQATESQWQFMRGTYVVNFA